MSFWLLALLASSQVPYELLALVFFCCFFPRGDRIDPVVLECCERANSNGNEKF